jgi:ubiquinone/menaquinone biosynthesis C-methylase UbiE
MLTVSQTSPPPFDAVAEDYDRKFTDSQIGRAQRSSVWDELAKTFRAGDRILEIGCGTGVDACFLANLGVKVFACDSSPAMIGVATRRITEARKSSLVALQVLSAENLASLEASSRFDGVLSDFGVLNCVEDLRGLVTNLARLLQPGAKAALCLMGRYCCWEIAWYLAHGNPDKAFRRIRNGAVAACLSQDTTVKVRYPSVRSLRRTFSPEFRLKSCKGIGIAVPPSYLENVVNRHPAIIRWMTLADCFLKSTPAVRGLADHVLLIFERTTTPDTSQ